MRKSEESSELNFKFFLSQFEMIRPIKNSDKSKIDLIFYHQIEGSCILKQYYKKDLTSIYRQLENIHHPNLPIIYHVLYYRGDTYVLEEYIQGQSLRELLEERKESKETARKPLDLKQDNLDAETLEEKRENDEGVLCFSEQEVISPIQQLCNALSILHGQKPPLIHRDIKPENIIVKEDGTIKLIDFDIARTYQEEKEKDTSLLGTEEYASPEHFGYGQTSEKSDIYSIGVLMHELLTGRLLEKRRVTYDGKFKTVIETCIQMDPERRYQTIEQLKIALETSFSDVEIVSKHEISKEGEYNKKNKKRKTERNEIVKIVLLLFCISISGGIYYTIASNIKNSEKQYEKEQVKMIPDIWISYKNGESPKRLLKNEVIEEKLETLLGVKYEYFMKGLEEVKEPSFNTKEDYYYVESNQEKLKSIIGSALVIHGDGTIECSFLQDNTYYYYAETKEGYEEPTMELVAWMMSNTGYPIIFKGKDEQENFEIAGNYIREDGYLQLEKEKNGTYSVSGMSYDSTTNIGRETKGVLKQVNESNWTYTQDWGSVMLEVRQFYDFLYVTTIEDNTQDTDNMRFDGLYKKS